MDLLRCGLVGREPLDHGEELELGLDAASGGAEFVDGFGGGCRNSYRQRGLKAPGLFAQLFYGGCGGCRFGITSYDAPGEADFSSARLAAPVKFYGAVERMFAGAVEAALLQREVPLGGFVGIVDQHQAGIVLQAFGLLDHRLLILPTNFAPKNLAIGVRNGT